MFNVKIYGAGSAGNHLAHACRIRGWKVTIVDVDSEAIRRTKEETYPARYGRWDRNIELYHYDQDPVGNWNLIILSTPPDARHQLIDEIENKDQFDLMLIEKPLCTPLLSDIEKFELKDQSKFLVAYNHNLTPNTDFFCTLISNKELGQLQHLDLSILENWKGIFKAHPWLESPADTYLGFTKRGGGATCEHSHGINLFMNLIRIAFGSDVDSVSAQMNSVSGESGIFYDDFMTATFKIGEQVVGRVTQDVVTHPAHKIALATFQNGTAEWILNYENNVDAVIIKTDNNSKTHRFKKNRPGDFIPQVEHIENILNGTIDVEHSPISLVNGIKTMRTIIGIIESNHKGTSIAL